MNNENLQRLMELARKTGDSLIVTDPSGDNPVVIMDVDKYEALMDVHFLANDGEFSEDFADEPVFEDDFVPPVEAYSPEVIEDVATEMQEMGPEDPHPAFDSVMEEQEPEMPEDPAGEERFYLEPIE